MKQRGALVGSLVAGLLASACCIGPLILGAVGLGSLGFAAALAPLRPWFLGLTVLLLAAGFYLAYRPLGKDACGPDGTCPTVPNRTIQRVILWVVTALTVVVASYPDWIGLLKSQRNANTSASSAPSTTILRVEGMTCTACEDEIEHEILRVPGVVGARVDYRSGRAEIRLATATADPAPLIAAVERAGYAATPTDAHERAQLGGQWRRELVVGDGRTSELVVDLGTVGSRWVGQFDLHGFGVEDYPVGVALNGRRVTLHLSAAEIDFEGTISVDGDLLAGIASTRAHSDSLLLRRVGDAQFGEGFLTLEKVAEDSTRVELLSADAAELRKQFNSDRMYTRLVMLLSPT